MLVSNFEVLITDNKNTRQETTYELLVTNLEDIDIEFLLEIHAAFINLRYGSANMADLSVGVIDGDFVSESPMQKDTHEFLRSIYFVIPAKATTLVRLSHVVSLQIRGYLNLRVPPVRNRLHYLINTQQSTPVKVLLEASRQDFFNSFNIDVRGENHNPAYKMFVNSQFTRQCVAIASGKALNEIEPEGIGFATKVGDIAHLLQLINAAGE